MVRFAEHKLNSSPNGDHANKNEAVGAFSTQRKDNSNRSYLNNLKEKDNMNELRLDGRILQNGY
jgi:hypothetical protein